MKRIFSVPPPFKVPDGTWVSPFLNAKDAMSDVPFALLDGFSMAAGRIDPHSRSQIHQMPLVAQVTYVYQGALQVVMQEPGGGEPYEQALDKGQAVFTALGTLFQLVNKSPHPCEVLYIVGPAYVFDMEDDMVLYDDALLLGEDWPLAMLKGPAAMGASALKMRAHQRADALRRIEKRKSERR
jgi:mannose-6-phosphate isomerase-like protein (cupin superfamily)